MLIAVCRGLRSRALKINYDPSFSIATSLGQRVLVVDLHGEEFGYGHVLLGLFHALRLAHAAGVRLAIRVPDSSPYLVDPGLQWTGVRRWPWWWPTSFAVQETTPNVRQMAIALNVKPALSAPCPPVRFSRGVSQRAHAIARSLGLDPSCRWVTWHCREGAGIGAKIDDQRDGDPSRFVPALDLLHEAGYRVVRLGDPSMTPIEHPALIHYWRSSERSVAMDLWFSRFADFLIASDSGPAILGRLVDRPMLMIGACSPQLYAYCATVLAKPLMDTHRDRAVTPDEREALSLWTAAGVEKANCAYEERRYVFQLNDAEEIVEAVRTFTQAS